MRRRHAFTLIELLVAMAIIAVLLGLLFPAVQAAREAARATRCRNNLKQLSLAIHNYHERTARFPSGWTAHQQTGLQGWGWGAQLLPELDQATLFQRLRFTESMTGPANLPFLALSLPVFLCPTNSSADTDVVIVQKPDMMPLRRQLAALHPPDPELYTMARADYAAVSGSTDIVSQPDQGNGLFYLNSSLQLRDVTDGTSQTLLFGERRVSEQSRRHFSGMNLTYIDLTVWAGVLPWCSDPVWRVVGACSQPPGNTSRGFPGFASQHPGSTFFAFADGSVRQLSDVIDRSTFQALATRSGGETATDF